MKFTGERFVPEVHGAIELEHLHRYYLAKEIVANKIVLDIASGEGYGSAMLAQTARKVFGVDISTDAVIHAKQKYQSDNLEFIAGSCAAIPLSDHCVDIVVSYETIEHHDMHDEMMREIKRVLKPDGCLLISSPDKLEYSDKPSFSNIHHVKELYRDEFSTLIKNYFNHHQILGQRMTYGSAILAENSTSKISTYQYDENGSNSFAGIKNAVYLIAIASDVSLPALTSGLLEQNLNDSDIIRFWSDTVEQLQFKVGSLNHQISNHAKVISDRDSVITKLTSNLIQLTTGYRSISTNHTVLKSELIKTDCRAFEVKKTVRLPSSESSTSQINDISPPNTQHIALPVSYGRYITSPFRFIFKQSKFALNAIQRYLSKFNLHASVFGTVKKAVKIYRREGIRGVKRGFRVLFKSVQLNLALNLKRGLASRSFNRLNRATNLETANGVWEWYAYDEVKLRIQTIKKNKIENFTAIPARIINSGTQDLIMLASSVKIPVPDSMPTVSIILPVFNNIRLTIECLLSISDSDITDNYEIIIADDCSTDNTAEIIQHIENVRYFKNHANLGFLANSNKALKHVTGKFVLYLNNDVQVNGRWLDELLQTFEEFPLAGAVGPKFIYPSGHLQEAGAALNIDGTSEMIGLNENPSQPRFLYVRRVDYVSGACLLIPTQLVKNLNGFSEEFLPCYCEDSDLCLRIQQKGYFVYCNPNVVVVHHLSKSTDALGIDFKLKCAYKNITTLKIKWQDYLQKIVHPRVIAFYLPQFHPIQENNQWWGQGFTEWTNVSKAKPNFVGHYQPRYPADLGYYDLRLPQILVEQAALAQRYGVSGFCFYYYWFDGARLLEQPLEQMLKSNEPDFPFCLCWANENWTRRWDGLDHEVLMAQAHLPDDDIAVINDLIRYFKDSRYIRIDGRPLLLIYRTSLFPNFAETATRWREICRSSGVGEIYLSSVESFDEVDGGKDPAAFGCDASVEFPPHGMGEALPIPGSLLNPTFVGNVAHYNDVAVKFATRPAPDYTRFRSVMPGWDNTARRQDTSYCFNQSTPGAFQAWLEESLRQTHLDRFGDEKLVFINAWNEWAEGAYLEPDRRFGHTYLEAVRNALDAKQLKD